MLHAGLCFLILFAGKGSKNHLELDERASKVPGGYYVPELHFSPGACKLPEICGVPGVGAAQRTALAITRCTSG